MTSLGNGGLGVNAPRTTEQEKLRLFGDLYGPDKSDEAEGGGIPLHSIFQQWQEFELSQEQFLIALNAMLGGETDP